MRSKALTTAAAALILAGAAACSSTSGASKSGGYGTSGGGAPATTSAPPATSAGGQGGQSAGTITIASFAFTTPLTVAAGATVTVTNTDSADHTVTADSGGAFNVPAPGGKTVTFTAPTTPGTYAYHCAIHPSMHGTLIVK